ncbi:MAG: DUF1080 domain-containing protein [Selenomonadaceae bacterium]|nr:DUF1080 domain-containing protein [Selenomonadaceae bacterium]
MNAENFIAVNVSAENFNLDNEKVLRVVKTEKLLDYDTNSIAKLKNSDFHNGTIEVKMLSRLLPDAPDYARGFIGIAFRINSDNSAFESFYIRPTNSNTSDPVRKAHGCQYFSFPKYTFAYFRENNITKYENQISQGLNEWVNLKAVVNDARADFYLNGVLTLTVEDLKLGKDSRGAVGFFVDIGTEAFYKDLKIVQTD